VNGDGLAKGHSVTGWSWGIVDVAVEKLFGPAEKTNITVPALLLKRIDAYVGASGNTRSGFLASAAVQAMRIHNSYASSVVQRRPHSMQEHAVQKTELDARGFQSCQEK
jgi:hypothetical protein